MSMTRHSLTGRAYKHEENQNDYLLFDERNIFQTVTTSPVIAIHYITGVIDFNPDTDSFSEPKRV
jgi:hypothetical protein